MQGPFLRKYGEAATINFQLYEVDGVDFRVDAVHASGDTTIMRDEAAEANTTNGFVDEGNGYSITLTATEMQAARIVVNVIDQGTKAWLDEAIVIETYGNASAQHAFDLDTALGTAGDLADAVLDEPLSGHTTTGTVGKLLSDVLEDTGTTLPALVNALENISADNVWDEVVEGTLTGRQAIRLVLAVLAGKSTGGGTSTLTFRDVADAKARITATVDANGNRTAITRDET